MPIVKTRLEILQVRKLIQCVRNQDSSQIDKMVAQGIPGLVNFQDAEKGYTALHIAVILNLDDVITQLLDNGASTSVQDLEGCTAVMRACEHGHLQALEALSVKGLSLHVADLSGNTPLFHCLHPTGRHLKCLSFLLEFGANPNVKSTSGRPLVYGVCELGYDKLLEKLLEKGADPNAREPGSGKPPVVISCESGHIECVKLLAKYGADLNATYSETKLCALHRAATLGHFEIIQVLSACGADFTLSTKTNDNAIHFATLAYKLLCIRFLGQRGCPANEPNEEGNTPQRLAKNEGYKDVMKEAKKLTGFQDKVAKGGKPKGFAEPYLVRLFDWLQINKDVVYNSLNTHERNKDGVLPVDVFTLCLNSLGVPLDEDQWTKLIKIYDKKGVGSINWYDIISDHKYVHAQYKLTANDDIKGKKGKKKKGGKKGGKKGKTKVLFPIYYEAAKPPMSGVSDSCIEREQLVTDYQRFSRDTPLPHSFIDDSAWYLIPPERQYIKLYEAVRHGDIESMMSAFHEGVFVDTRDKYNKTPLMIASAHGRLDVVKFLLRERADINAIDNFMWTPLHHACHAGEEEVVKLLLDSGANIDTQSYNGGTPLMRAIETSQKSIVKLLIDKGAKLTAVNKHGETALDVARNWGDDYIYAVVYAKAASLPPPPEAKGKGKEKGTKEKGGKKGKKGGEVSPSDVAIPGPPLLPIPPSPRLPTPFESLEQTRRRYSFQSLQSDLSVKPSPNYQPKPAWISRPHSTQIFQQEQVKAREERGTESIDFGELRTPFQLQIIARAEALEITDL